MPTMFSAMLPTIGTITRPRKAAEMPTSAITPSRVPTNTSEITATAAVEASEQHDRKPRRPVRAGRVAGWAPAPLRK